MTTLSVRRPPLLVRAAEQVNYSLERHFWRWAALFVLLFLASSIAIDLRTQMWLDELFTFYIAKQPGTRQIIAAIMEGCDGSPPIYAMIVQHLLPFVKSELAVRLPSTLGFCGMLLAMMAFCRRRLPAAHSYVAALIACYLCLYYSTDGRPYGVVFGCVAGALLCWQLAAEGRRRSVTIPLLAVLLALMVAMHYFAIFFLIPLALAELWRARSRGKLDFGVIAAMLPAPVILAAHYPLIAASRRFQTHYWSPATLRAIEPFYDKFFLPVLQIACVGLFVLAAWPKSRHDEDDEYQMNRERFRAHEWIALGAIALMPIVVVAVSTYTTHVFVDRYVLWAVVGFALLAAALVCRASNGRAAVGLTIIALMLVFIVRQERLALKRAGTLRDSPELTAALDRLPDGPEPIVVAGDHEFLELDHYAIPRIRQRLMYVANPEADLRYLRTDTSTLLLMALSHRIPIHVEPYQAILAKYHRFLVAATSENYLPLYMAAVAGCRVSAVDTVSLEPLVYEVDAPDPRLH